MGFCPSDRGLCAPASPLSRKLGRKDAVNAKQRRKERRKRQREEQSRDLTPIPEVARGLHAEAARKGLTLTFANRGRHWLIDDAASGRRVVEYWPGNGRWWTPNGGQKGKLERGEILAFAAGMKAMPQSRERTIHRAVDGSEAHLRAIQSGR